MNAPRYAVYFAPAEDTALWRLASAVIGWDAVKGEAVTFPAIAPCDDPDWVELSEEPRRYGFHGTLKAPFELTQGADEGLLLAAADGFARERSGFALDDMTVAAISSFVAVVPGSASEALQRLAADCVVAFEPFRAPMSAADRARRLKSPLTERQIAAVDRWGYPYVFEDFRFHMTLTGPVPEARRGAVRAALAALVEPVARPLAVDAIAVFRQDDRAGRFRQVARFPFGAMPAHETTP